MKKGWKLFWIICGSLAAAGVILLAASILSGGLSEETREAENAWFWDHLGSKWATKVTNGQESENLLPKEEISEIVGAPKSESTPKSEEIPLQQGTHGHHADVDHGSAYTGIRTVEIECGALEVQISVYDGDEVELDKSQLRSDLVSSIVCEQDDDELEIEALCGRKRILGDPGVLIVRLPASLDLETFAASVGAGVLHVTGVEAKNYMIEVGAGEVQCTLPGIYDDYDYDIDCGMGEVVIGDREYGGFAQDVEIDNGKGRWIDIDCGMGEVTIQFEGND